MTNSNESSAQQDKRTVSIGIIVCVLCICIGCVAAILYNRRMVSASSATDAIVANATVVEEETEVVETIVSEVETTVSDELSEDAVIFDFNPKDFAVVGVKFEGDCFDEIAEKMGLSPYSENEWGKYKEYDLFLLNDELTYGGEGEEVTKIARLLKMYSADTDTAKGMTWNMECDWLKKAYETSSWVKPSNYDNEILLHLCPKEMSNASIEGEQYNNVDSTFISGFPIWVATAEDLERIFHINEIKDKLGYEACTSASYESNIPDSRFSCFYDDITRCVYEFGSWKVYFSTIPADDAYYAVSYAYVVE